MESISNAAAAVGRVVGLTGEDAQKTQHTQSGSEPLSGVTGRGTADEPYDGGNQEEMKPNESSKLGGTSEHTERSTSNSGADSGSDGIPNAQAADSGLSRDGQVGGSSLDTGQQPPQSSRLDNASGPESFGVPNAQAADAGLDRQGQIGGDALTPGQSHQSTSDRSAGSESFGVPGAQRAEGALDRQGQIGGRSLEPSYGQSQRSTSGQRTGPGSYGIPDPHTADSGLSGTGKVGGTSLESGREETGESKSGLGSGPESYGVPSAHTADSGLDSQGNVGGGSLGSGSTDAQQPTSGYGSDPTSFGVPDAQTADSGLDRRGQVGGSLLETGQGSSTHDSSSSHTAVERGSTTGGEGSTISNRLPGQNDTTTGPSGGIAQGGVAQGVNITGHVRPEHDTEKTGVTGIHSNDPKFSVGEPSSSGATFSKTVEPSVSADPRSGQKPTPKHQGADRPFEQPSAESEQAIRETKEREERALDQDHDSARDARRGSLLDNPSNEHHPGQPGGDFLVGGQPKEKGTGQQYVKSTGMAAEGGDFDASRPGAGREADRLLEQSGVHRTGVPHVGLGEEGAAGGGSKGSHSVGEKIKEKLHLGGHH
ncbi:MAG: hypothetical protein M1823_000922 [Watsoniomyces obsoletus]|nr:MAG: hypothetical protein M1823_000922 [Watsoniomyces obsoletus]